MRHWAETAERIRATSRTSEKTAIVADYLASLASLTPDSLPLAATFLSGRPFPERDQRTTGLGWSAITQTVVELAGAGPTVLRDAYDRSSDLGTAVGEVLAAAGHGPPPDAPALTLPNVKDLFAGLAAARGRSDKQQVFRALLDGCDPLMACYVVRILSSELRIGLREGHLEAGIALAFGRRLADVQWAGMLTGDIGRTAELARGDTLDQAILAPFHPLKSMLASPVATEAEALARMAPPVWVEDKYDGIRAQLHKVGGEVRLFSRDLNEISAQFPEVVRAAGILTWDGILDGEVLGWKDGAVLPFIALQGRLGRKAPSEAIQAEVPVIYVAFDALALGFDGQGSVDRSTIEPLLRSPLRERRARLEALGLTTTPGFGLAALEDAADEHGLRAVFEAAQARGNEGLMLKDPDSPYAPGRRGFAWLKLKKALTTLDCVVVGVEVGHGRRHGVLSDYTFAVLDDRPDAPEGHLVTIGKAYSGLTDAEIAQMTRWFEAHTISLHGRYRVVEPSIVVEIAFDVIHRSSRHGSGFALRFPRIVRLRPDRDRAGIDRLSTVAAIHDRLQVAGRYGVLTAGAMGRAEGAGR